MSQEEEYIPIIVSLEARGTVTIEVPKRIHDKLENEYLTYKEICQLNLLDFVDWDNALNELEWDVDPYD